MWSGSHPQIASDTTISKAQFVCTTVYGGNWAEFFRGEDVNSFGQDLLDAADARAEATFEHLNSPPPKAATPVPTTNAPETHELTHSDTGMPDTAQSLIHAGIEADIVEPSLPAVATPAAPPLGEYLDGYEFIFGTPNVTPAWWGTGKDVLAAKGEATMLCGTPGLGKTTLEAQLVRASLGLQTHVLGQPVEAAPRVLVLAMDRPAQIGRVFKRLFDATDTATVRDRLVVRQGPPPAEIAKNPDELLRICQAAGLRAGDRLFVDSIKDAAIGLSEDTVGAGYNRARQIVLAAGIDVFELHHMVKRASDGTGAPKSLSDVYGSTWLASGAGSVFVLSGDAGDSYVNLAHMKQPMEPFGPVTIAHDHDTGISTVDPGTDILSIVRAAGTAGITVKDVARDMFAAPTPTRNQEASARRALNKLTTNGILVETAGAHGGAAGGRTASTWSINLTGAIREPE